MPLSRQGITCSGPSERLMVAPPQSGRTPLFALIADRDLDAQDYASSALPIAASSRRDGRDALRRSFRASPTCRHRNPGPASTVSSWRALGWKRRARHSDVLVSGSTVASRERARPPARTRFGRSRPAGDAVRRKSTPRHLSSICARADAPHARDAGQIRAIPDDLDGRVQRDVEQRAQPSHTTTPPIAPPLSMHGVQSALRYVSRQSGGDGADSEQWDYFECAATCGSFRTRGKRKRGAARSVLRQSNRPREISRTHHRRDRASDDASSPAHGTPLRTAAPRGTGRSGARVKTSTML